MEKFRKTGESSQKIMEYFDIFYNEDQTQQDKQCFQRSRHIAYFVEFDSLSENEVFRNLYNTYLLVY